MALYTLCMKIRAALLPLALLVIVGTQSCVREYQCRCWVKYTGQPGLPDSVRRDYTIRDTKDKARDLCTANSFDAKDTRSNITTKETCDLY